MDSPVLSVVVLAWNQLPLTRRCVASIRDNSDVPYELIVVDNGSHHEAAAFAEEAADVAILNETNRGFAPGMNQGLAAARGTHVAFVNNDTELPVSWASRLIETFHSRSDAGVALPAVTAAGNPFAVRTEAGTGVVEVPPFRELPSGVLYLMERQTAVELGGWSEEFEVASREDLDLLFKVWCNGLRVLLDERVLVPHASSATVAAHLPDRRARWAANWDVFVSKWTAADAASIPRLDRCDPEVFAQRLVAARAAASWMARWYQADQRARRVERIVEKAEAGRRELEEEARTRPGGSGRLLRSAWSAMRPLIPTPVRERLFPRLRGLYYTAYPERRTNGVPPSSDRG